MTTARATLLGPSYFHHRALIEASKTWSAGQIREYQQQRTAALADRYGPEVRQKEHYRQDPGRYTRWDVPLLSHTVRTGGTSGQPLRFRADTLSRRQKERAYLFDIWSGVGYAPHDLRVCYRGHIHGGLIRYSRLENAWLISPGATLEHELGRLRRWVRTLPPFFLHVYASSLATFIELIGEELFRSLPVRGVLAGSEAFPVGEQDRFEQNYGLRIAHWYGHSEYAALAYCCRECRGFHFYPTYGQVELLPSETEGCRRIVASSFNRVGTQFVRYDTGDLAVAASGTCAANNFPRVQAIVGRSQETFVDAAGRRRALGPYLFGIHGPFWDQIKDLQLIQDRPGHLLVRFVAQARADRDLIREVLERRMPMVSLEFECVPAVERNANGKRRYFIDALQTPVLLAPPVAVPPVPVAGAAARTPAAWRWLAAAGVILAVAVLAMSVLAIGAIGGRPVTGRAHHPRSSIVRVRAPARYGNTAPSQRTA